MENSPGNWLTQLRRLTNAEICSQQAGDLGEPMVRFSSKGQQARDPGRAHVAVRVLGRRKPLSQLKAVRQEGFSPSRRLSLFVLFRPSTDWMRRPTLEGQSALQIPPETPPQTHPEYRLTNCLGILCPSQVDT